jgi:hypothetical protein
LSPTQTTPGQYTNERRGKEDIDDENDILVDKTDNLKNFMEIAQPGQGILDS